MSAYNIGMLIGLIVGIMGGIVLLCLILVLTTKNHKVKRNYDERQELVRGKGFKYGFITIVAANIFLGFSQMLFMKPYADTYSLMMLSVGLGVLVDVHYCIWNDGYFSLNENPKMFMIIFAIMALIQYIMSFANMAEGLLVVDGMLSYRASNLIVAMMLTFTIVDLLIKNAYAKKEDE